MNLYRKCKDSAKKFSDVRQDKWALIALIIMLTASTILLIVTLQSKYFNKSTSQTTKEVPKIERNVQERTKFGKTFVDTLANSVRSLLKETPAFSNCYELEIALHQYKQCLLTYQNESFNYTKLRSLKSMPDTLQDRMETITVMDNPNSDHVNNNESKPVDLKGSERQDNDSQESQQSLKLENVKMLCRIILNQPSCLEAFDNNLPCRSEMPFITQCIISDLINISKTIEKEVGVILCKKEEGLINLLEMHKFFDDECYLNFVKEVLSCRNKLYLKEVKHISTTCRNLEKMEDCVNDYLLNLDQIIINGVECTRNSYMDYYYLYYKFVFDHKVFKSCIDKQNRAKSICAPAKKLREFQEKSYWNLNKKFY